MPVDRLGVTAGTQPIVFEPDRADDNATYPSLAQPEMYPTSVDSVISDVDAFDWAVVKLMMDVA